MKKIISYDAKRIEKASVFCYAHNSKGIVTAVCTFANGIEFEEKPNIVLAHALKTAFNIAKVVAKENGVNKHFADKGVKIPEAIREEGAKAIRGAVENSLFYCTNVTPILDENGVECFECSISPLFVSDVKLSQTALGMRKVAFEHAAKLTDFKAWRKFAVRCINVEFNANGLRALLRDENMSVADIIKRVDDMDAFNAEIEEEETAHDEAVANGWV